MKKQNVVKTKCLECLRYNNFESKDCIECELLRENKVPKQIIDNVIYVDFKQKKRIYK